MDRDTFLLSLTACYSNFREGSCLPAVKALTLSDCKETMLFNIYIYVST